MRLSGGAVLAALNAVATVTLVSCASDAPPTVTTHVTSPAAGAATTTATSAGPTVFTPVIGSVIAEPVPVPATDGKIHLAYEVKLTNVLGQDLTLTSVAAVTEDKTLLTLSGEQLARWTRVLGDRITETATIGPGQTALVWIDIPLDQPSPGTPAAIPQQLSHTVSVSITKPARPLLTATMTESLAGTAVDNREPMSIAPPLAGPNWVAGESCCEMTTHRMAVNPLNGGLWAAERFAIDYVQLTDGRMFTGAANQLTSYPYYGADVHAVTDGPVVAAVDGRPDQVPGTSPAGLELDEYPGNYVVQEIGSGDFALYAHLKPGSVKVKPGEPLTAGQPIGALGNSGNSDAPHLHFHVMSTPDPLRSNGLPFVFTRFQLTGRLAALGVLDQIEAGRPAELQPGFASRDENDVIPLVLDVMAYGPR